MRRSNRSISASRSRLGFRDVLKVPVDMQTTAWRMRSNTFRRTAVTLAYISDPQSSFKRHCRIEESENRAVCTPTHRWEESQKVQMIHAIVQKVWICRAHVRWVSTQALEISSSSHAVHVRLEDVSKCWRICWILNKTSFYLCFSHIHFCKK